MHDRLPAASRVLALALALTMAAACATAPPESKIANDTTPTRIALKDFVLFLSNKVESTADSIAQIVTDPTMRRSTVYWKMRVIPLAQQALLAPQNEAAAIQLWVITVMMEKSFSDDGATPHLFGAGQHLAQDAAKEMQVQARDLAKGILDPKLFAKLEPQVNALVKNNMPDKGLSLSPDKSLTWGQTLTSIAKTPLDLIKAPVQSLNPTSGLSDTAIAMQNFTDEFSRARTEMSYLPRTLRWQAQLLLLEAEETVNLSGMADGVAQVGTSADSLADTAKQLPEQLRTELTAFVTDLSKPQGELQATLKEANTTLTNSRETAQALDTMGTTFTQMFGVFDKLMGTLGVGPDDADSTVAGTAKAAPAADPASEGAPFDINDYGRTAEKLTEMATALTALLEKTTDLADAPEPPPLLVDTEATARTLMDRFFLGSAALIVFGAAVAFLYRKATARHRAA